MQIRPVAALAVGCSLIIAGCGSLGLDQVSGAPAPEKKPSTAEAPEPTDVADAITKILGGKRTCDLLNAATVGKAVEGYKFKKHQSQDDDKGRSYDGTRCMVEDGKTTHDSTVSLDLEPGPYTSDSIVYVEDRIQNDVNGRPGVAIDVAQESDSCAVVLSAGQSYSLAVNARIYGKGLKGSCDVANQVAHDVEPSIIGSKYRDPKGDQLPREFPKDPFQRYNACEVLSKGVRGMTFDGHKVEPQERDDPAREKASCYVTLATANKTFGDDPMVSMTFAPGPYDYVPKGQGKIWVTKGNVNGRPGRLLDYGKSASKCTVQLEVAKDDSVHLDASYPGKKRQKNCDFASRVAEKVEPRLPKVEK